MSPADEGGKWYDSRTAMLYDHAFQDDDVMMLFEEGDEGYPKLDVELVRRHIDG